MINFKLVVFIFGGFVSFVIGEDYLQDPVLSNLDDYCLYCLCVTPSSSCDLDYGCQDGFCGPYKIKLKYWIDSGNVTLPGDSPTGPGAYENCTKNYDCAQRTVVNYLAKYTRDCNGDGVTDCLDYLLMNVNGRKNCETPLENKRNGNFYLRRFYRCYPKQKRKLA